MNEKQRIRHNDRARMRRYRREMERFNNEQRKTEPTICFKCRYCKCKCPDKIETQEK